MSRYSQNKPISGEKIYEDDPCKDQFDEFVRDYGFYETIEDFDEFIKDAEQRSGWIDFLIENEYINKEGGALKIFLENEFDPTSAAADPPLVYNEDDKKHYYAFYYDNDDDTVLCLNPFTGVYDWCDDGYLVIEERSFEDIYKVKKKEE